MPHLAIKVAHVAFVGQQRGDYACCDDNDGRDANISVTITAEKKNEYLQWFAGIFG